MLVLVDLLPIYTRGNGQFSLTGVIERVSLSSLCLCSADNRRLQASLCVFDEGLSFNLIMSALKSVYFSGVEICSCLWELQEVFALVHLTSCVGCQFGSLEYFWGFTLKHWTVATERWRPNTPQPELLLVGCALGQGQSFLVTMIFLLILYFLRWFFFFFFFFFFF